jgi:hypothetical protein
MTDPRDDRSLRAQLDRLERDVPPARDLWPGVARGIEAARRRARWTRGLVAAGTLAAAAAVVLALGMRGGEQAASPVAVAPAISSPAPAPMAAAPPPPLPGETDYRGAERLLAAELDARRVALPAAQMALLDDGLRVIDEAIDSTRAAVREHPDDPELRAELDRVWEDKLDLLRQATELTSEL